VTKNEARHMCGLMSEWLNEASILLFVFGILDHTFSRTDTLLFQVGKFLGFIGASIALFGRAVKVKLAESKIK
jgi:hypothetical protein